MDELREVADRARHYARAHPITEASLNVARERPTLFNPYRFTINHQFDCLVFYEVFQRDDIAMPPPLWHVQVAVMDVVGELEFGAVKEALLATQAWSPLQMKVVSDIMGECLAPEIRRATQPVHVHFGLWDCHWFTPYEHPDELRDNN